MRIAMVSEHADPTAAPAERRRRRERRCRCAGQGSRGTGPDDHRLTRLASLGTEPVVTSRSRR